MSISYVDIKLSRDRKYLEFPQLEDNFRVKYLDLKRNSYTGEATLTSDGLKITFCRDETTMNCVNALDHEMQAVLSDDKKLSDRDTVRNKENKDFSLSKPKSSTHASADKNRFLFSPKVVQPKSRGSNMLNAMKNSSRSVSVKRESASPPRRRPAVSSEEHLSKVCRLCVVCVTVPTHDLRSTQSVSGLQ